MPNLLLILTLLTGCTAYEDNRRYYLAPVGDEDPRPFINTAEELQHYVSVFEEEMSVTVGVPVNFAYIERERTSAYCSTQYTNSDVYQHVAVSIRWYEKNKNNQYALLWLIFHELGHCALGKDHDDRLTEDGRPVSIMNSSMDELTPIYFEDHYDEYVTSLRE